MKNKKGFTLVELLVSFALITAISLAFFRTILSLQQEQLKNIAKNNYKAFTIVLNNSIQKDFLNDNIEKIISCGDSCYDITYTKNGIVRLSLDKENKIITYGNIKEKLPADYKFIGDIEFTSYINSYDGNDSYIALNINVKSTYEKGIDNIKYVYQYDSDNEIIELDVDGAEASDIIEYLLYKSPEENGLYEPLLPNGTSTGIRYRGENPNNYVYFNCEDKDSNNVNYGEENYNYKDSCEIWRIIGVFDVDNGKGNVEKRVKLIRNEVLINASWDSSADGTNNGEIAINAGLGINEWSQSDLKNMLNTYYIGENSNCVYCDRLNQSSCTNSCNEKITVLSKTSLKMIDNVIWALGSQSSISNDILSVQEIYNSERSNVSGKICVETNEFDGIYCNDTITRTTTWLGLIGLIYPSDYGYGSDDKRCLNNVYGKSSYCTNNNWLQMKNANYWTLTPRHNSYSANGIWYISIDNVVDASVAYATSVRPSLYLKSNVTFINDGNGTEDSPYILGINE